LKKGIKRILVVGSVGQIGTDLTPVLRERFGSENVIAAGHQTMPSEDFRAAGPFLAIDATDKEMLRRTVAKFDINTIYHLGAILSGEGEKNPELAWKVNMTSLKNVLDLAVEKKMDQVFWPSSIAVFGPTTPRCNVPQNTVLEPTTMYGVTKLSGENLCHYYFLRYGLDVRSLRYPGLITYRTFSGGGTSDYSVEMFIHAIKSGRYTCFVTAETKMPLMYMDDAIRATVELMEADASKITVRTSYNLAALSFSAEELAGEIAKAVEGFTCEYVPDFRQAIADSWPDSVDDSVAHRDWGWSHKYGLKELADIMLRGMRESIASGSI
jgi:nucleoside-diphosphate-sugar epimerase